MSESEPDVDSLTVLFGGLELTIRRRPGRAHSSLAEDFEIVIPERPEASARPESSEAEVLTAGTPEEFAALHLPALEPLARRLASTTGAWTAFCPASSSLSSGCGSSAAFGRRPKGGLPLSSRLPQRLLHRAAGAWSGGRPLDTCVPNVCGCSAGPRPSKGTL